MIVKQDIRQMSGQQGINATTGSHQEDLRIKNASAQTPRQHSWEVDAGNPRGAMDHFQRQAKYQLNGNIEAEVEPSGV